MPDGVVNALPLVALVFFGYLLLIRPARKRAQEVSALQAALSPGDDVMLTSGIFGRIQAVVDDRAEIEIAPGVVVSVHKGAISKIVRDVGEYSEPGDETAADDGTDIDPDHGRGVG